MAQSSDHFKGFEPHTLLKHAVLKAYLQTWSRKMLLRPGATSAICIVDACAGAGRDEEGNPGSPVLAAEVAADAERQLQEDPRLRARLRGPIRIQLVAIEKKPSFYRRLVKNLSEHSQRVSVLHGTLAEYIDEHYEQLKDTPTLFFIDPFGLAPVQADVIRRALRGPKNEVLLLFADQAALRHFGVATASALDVEAEIAARTEQFGLFEAPEAQLSNARKEVQARTTALELTAPIAVQILNAAFGSDNWRSIIEATPQRERRRRFEDLYVELLHSFGATHVLPLRMRNDRDQHVYTLLHATQSVHGYTAMKEVISSALERAPLSEVAIASMRFQIASDLPAVERTIRRRFAATTVPWAEQPDGSPSIRQFVLEETPAFNFELRTLRKRLSNEKCGGRGPEMYTFPPAPDA